MIKTTVMPKETLAELLLFLAERERFASVAEHLGGGVTVEETRAAMRELARELTREAGAERAGRGEDARSNKHLSPKTRQIISYLSDIEEKKLLKAFGLAE